MKTEDMNTHKTSPDYQPNKSGKGLIAGLSTALVLVLIVGAIAFSGNQKKNKQAQTSLEEQKLELTVNLSQRDSIINEWVLAFNEIESDIKKITARENMLSLQSMNPEISKDKKEEILKEIQLIREVIDQNKKKLVSLNAQLKNSGIKIASLQARMDTLDAEIAERDNVILILNSELTTRHVEIVQLSEKVDTMAATIVEKETRISEQTADLNKAFVVTGTYKDLKEKGLLTKEGGVLGLGRKESLQENFENENLFTAIDITQTLTIPVNSKTAKLVTEHPANSYTMVKDDADKVAYIEIRNPATFWKISKYAVVEVNN
ncbi:MAG TPA: hypothetical protein VJ203_11385 [Bacteroidales bacterium]|nr:hypothetical protein [Bacteroidales bacterium]